MDKGVSLLLWRFFADIGELWGKTALFWQGGWPEFCAKGYVCMCILDVYVGVSLCDQEDHANSIRILSLINYDIRKVSFLGSIIVILHNVASTSLK